jgi:Fe-S-cluster-containing hydrogenase component 2
MNDDELPVVIPEKCTACNDCVVTCPKDLFVLMPIEQKLIVQCRNLVHGDPAEAMCSVACNACSRCVADAQPGLIEMVDNLAVIDYEKNALADPKATSRCPTDAIVWVEGQQFVKGSPELEKRAV